MNDLKAQKHQLAALIAQRDELSRYLGRHLKDWDYARVREKEMELEALARLIAARKAAITRAGGEWSE